MIRNGMPKATIVKYCAAYSIVSSLAPIALHIGVLKIHITIIETTPTTKLVQKLKEEVRFASSFLPSPNILLIKLVEPIPNNMPTAINNKNAGVATETAATI